MPTAELFRKRELVGRARREAGVEIVKVLYLFGIETHIYLSIKSLIHCGAFAGTRLGRGESGHRALTWPVHAERVRPAP